MNELSVGIGKHLSLASSPAENTVAIGLLDGKILLWQIESRKKARKLRNDSRSGVSSVSYSSNGKFIAAGLRDNVIELWDLQSGEIVNAFGEHEEVPPYATNVRWGVKSVSFSPDGEFIAGSSVTLRANVWNTGSSQLEAIIPNGDSISFSPTGRFIALGFFGVIRTWRMDSLEALSVIEEDRYVSSVAYSPIKNILASGSFDGRVKIWDAYFLTRLQTLGQRVPEGVEDEIHPTSIAFNPIKDRIGVGFSDGLIKIWNFSGELLSTLATGVVELGTVVVEYSPDGEFIAAGYRDRTIRIWQATSGELLYTLGQQEAWPPQGGVIPDGIWSLDYSPDGQVIASGLLYGTIEIWDAATGVLLHTLEHIHQNEGPSPVSVRYTPNGDFLVSAAGNTIKIWRRLDYSLVNWFEGTLEGYLGGLEFSSDGRFFATTDSKQVVAIWDTGSWQRLTLLDGSYSAIATSTGRTVSIFDTSFNLIIDNILSRPERLRPGQLFLFYVISQFSLSRDLPVDLEAIENALKIRFGGVIPEILDLQRHYYSLDDSIRRIVYECFLR